MIIFCKILQYDKFYNSTTILVINISIYLVYAFFHKIYILKTS